MFIAGDSDDAKKTVSTILNDFGWGVVDVGGIESSRHLEAMCMVWVLTAMRTNNWNQAFKLLRKGTRRLIRPTPGASSANPGWDIASPPADSPASS